MDLFQKATRKKIRFVTSFGSITTEDLWDLSLEQLDAIAQDLHKAIKDGETVSFINAPETSDAYKENKLKFDVVKSIIDIRLADKERAEKAAATRAKKQRIMALIEEKQDEDLKGKSAEELSALLEEI